MHGERVSSSRYLYERAYSVEFIKIYCTTLVSFLVLDSVWLGLIAPAFYRKHIGFIMAKNPNFLAAALFYGVFITGLVLFVIQPALDASSWRDALCRGALFGLVSYATFDLTNQAVLKNWPWTVTVTDLMWGSFITATVAVVAFSLIQKFIV